MPGGDVVVDRDRPVPVRPRLSRVLRPAVDAHASLEWTERLVARLEGLGVPLFLALSVLYGAVTWVFASRKLMWNDELYTYYMAVLPSMRDVWAALLTGGEQTPPLFYLITRASMELLGASHVTIRLPEMLGFWMMSACLFVFVARRTSSFPALSAAALPLVTTAYYYAFEARAYGLVLGFAALALVCWQSVALDRRRALAIGGLAASLAVAVSTHYYAVFVVVALAIGELARTVSQRRVDLAIWIAFAVPALPLALQLPLIRAGRQYSGGFWSPPQWIHVPEFYTDLLTPTIVPVAGIVVVAVIYAVAAGAGRPRAADALSAGVPFHEVAAACGLLAIPLMAVIAAKVATGAFVNRYALPAVIGFAVLGGFATAVAFARHPILRLTSVACLVGWFVLAQAREYLEPTGLSLPVSPVTIERADAWLRGAPDSRLPFVVGDPHTFAVLTHYGSAEVRSRMVYLADPALALRRLGHNSVERGMVDLLRPWFGMHVIDFEPFYVRHPEFLVYGDFVRLNFLNWMLPELQARGMHLELLNRQGDHLLLLASRGPRAPEARVPSTASTAPQNGRIASPDTR